MVEVSADGAVDFAGQSGKRAGSKAWNIHDHCQIWNGDGSFVVVSTSRQEMTISETKLEVAGWNVVGVMTELGSSAEILAIRAAFGESDSPILWSRA